MRRGHPLELENGFGFGVVVAPAKNRFLSLRKGQTKQSEKKNEMFHISKVGMISEGAQPLRTALGILDPEGRPPLQTFHRTKHRSCQKSLG